MSNPNAVGVRSAVEVRATRHLCESAMNGQVITSILNPTTLCVSSQNNSRYPKCGEIRKAGKEDTHANTFEGLVAHARMVA